MLNTLSLREIVEAQDGFYFGFIPAWNIFQVPFPQILSFIIFLIAAFAETNRVPFDLPEAENELVAGFHTEYSSMKFAAFFMAEYANMVTVACMATLLFLGGWHAAVPGSSTARTSCPALIFVGGWRRSASITGCNPARPFDRITLPVFGVYLSRHRGCCSLIPMLQAILHAAVLVLRQDGLPAVRVHLGSRHAAALPL